MCYYFRRQRPGDSEMAPQLVGIARNGLGNDAAASWTQAEKAANRQSFRQARIGCSEREDDRSVKDLLDRLGDIEQREETGENGQDQRADYGSRIATSSAEDGRAADDHA